MGKLRSPLKLLAATSMTIFSLLSVFTATYTWFDARRYNNNQANDMAIEAVYDLESLSVYRPTIGGTSEFSYVFSGTPSASVTIGGDVSASINMGEDAHPYSPLEPYHPLLFVARYKLDLNTAVEGNIRVKAVGAEGYVVPVAGYDNSHRIDPENDEVKVYPLSSIASFKAKSYASEAAFAADFGYTQENQYYTCATSSFSSWHSSSFVTIDHSNNEAVTIDDECEIIKVTSGTVRVIAFLLEYNVDSINYISSYYMGEDFLTEDIAFACDWTLEI